MTKIGPGFRSPFGQARGWQYPTLPPPGPTPEELAQPWWSRLGTAAVDIPMALLDALDYFAAMPRAAIGRAAGIEGTGRETIFGQAPSGRELIGLGPGEKGKWEWGDVPGFLAELAVDPLMYLGAPGALTKAGKAALRASKLATTARVAMTEGNRPAVRRAVKALHDMGHTYGSAKAIEAGISKPAERALLSLRPLGMKTGLPLHLTGGRLSAAAAKGARGAKEWALRGQVGGMQPLGGIARRLRPGGRLGVESLEELTPAARRRMIDWNELITQKQQAYRARRQAVTEMRPGLEELGGIVTPAQASAALARIRAKMPELPLKGRLPKETAEALGGKAQVIPAPTGKPEDVWRLLDIATEEVKNVNEIKIANIWRKTSEKIDRAYKKSQAKIAKWPEAKRGEWERYELHFFEDHRLKLIDEAAEKIAWLKGGKDIIARELPDEMKQAIQRLRAAAGTVLETEQAAGLRVSGLERYFYLPRILTREGRQRALKLPTDSPFHQLVRAHGTAAGFMQQRNKAFDLLSIPSVNELFRQSTGFKGNLFVENAADALLVRGMSGARTQANVGLWSGALELFALPQDMAGPNAKKMVDAIADAVKKSKIRPLGGITRIGREVKDLPMDRKGIAMALKGTKFEGKFIPRDVWDALSKVDEVMNDPDDLKSMWKLFDRINSWMRFWVTQPFPAFHSRNKFSNWFMMAMAGMRAPGRVFAAHRDTVAVAKGTANPEQMTWWRRAVQYGSAGHGRAWDVMQMRGPMGPGRKQLSAAARQITRGAQVLEDADKLALFKWAVEVKGMTFEEAGALTRRWLFDYEDLSRFERHYLRRIAFFWTFARKNLPLMVEEIVTQPRRMQLLGKTMGVAGEAFGTLPPWLRDRAPFDWGLDDEGKRIFVTAGLPYEDIFRFGSEGRGLKRTLQKLAGQMAPLPRVPIERLAGISLQTGLPHRARPGLGQRAAAGLPEGLQRELAPLLQWGEMMPTTRMSSLLRQVMELEQFGGERRLGDVAMQQTLGITGKRMDLPQERLKSRLRDINRAIAQRVSLGESKSPRAKELRSLRARLSRQLGMMR